MAGHSQFKNIMHRKGRQDAARSKLFAKLAREFESCVYGLNLVKGDLEEMQHPITRRANEIVM